MSLTLPFERSVSPGRSELRSAVIVEMLEVTRKEPEAKYLSGGCRVFYTHATLSGATRWFSPKQRVKEFVIFTALAQDPF